MVHRAVGANSSEREEVMPRLKERKIRTHAPGRAGRTQCGRNAYDLLVALILPGEGPPTCERCLAGEQTSRRSPRKSEERRTE